MNHTVAIFAKQLHRLLYFSIAFLVLSSVTPSQGDLIVNGDFESGNFGSAVSTIS